MKPAELEILFDEIICLKGKAHMNRSQFCSELIKSDADEFLDLHFSFIEKQNKFLNSDLKMYFGFRQDKCKVHQFLKSKLNGISDKSLQKDIADIVEAINYLELDDYKHWFADLVNRKRTNENEFVWSLMKSPYIEYHYQLIRDKEHVEESLRTDLKSRFSKHGDNGEDFLLSKLDQNEDSEIHAEIIFMLGQIKGKQEKRTLEYARKLCGNGDDYTRDRAIIVLGWLGTDADFDMLGEHLLNDPNPNCRAWSASSFYHIWSRKQIEQLKSKAFESFYRALQTEKNLFVLSTIIFAVQEVAKKKFGITQKTLAHLDEVEITKAKIKIEKYLIGKY